MKARHGFIEITSDAGLTINHSQIIDLVTMSNSTQFSPERVADPLIERIKINLGWLLRLRWAAACGQVLTVIVATLWYEADLLLVELLSIIALEFITNAAFAWWFKRQLRSDTWEQNSVWGERLLGGVMLLDILLLSGLLYLTGGAENPFSIFYLINLSLGAVVLRPYGALLLATVSAICFSVLVVYSQPLPALERSMPIPLALGASDALLNVKMQGLWVSLVGASMFIVYFITRVTTALGRREEELSLAEKRRAQAEKLEALATLAAGAAHELASPLSTIAVVARELEVELERGGAANHAVQDAQLIRREVTRCRGILDLMASDAGESTGEEIVELTLQELIAQMMDGIPDAGRVKTKMVGGSEDSKLIVPRHALVQSLRGLVRNALDASPLDGHVELRTTVNGAKLEFEIRDRGTGMSSEVLDRAGEPFFTTKEPGQGMGLGLFLTRKVIERLDGSLQLVSHPGKGTTAIVMLPLAGKNDGRAGD